MPCYYTPTIYIALIAPDEDSLQRMLDIVHRWCQKWRMSLNVEKTKILHFRNKNIERSTFNFRCGGVKIDFDKVYRYLGLTFNEYMDYKYTVRELTKSASRALSAIYTKFISCGGMSYDVYTKLYKTLVESILYYGAGIWGHANWREVQAIKNKACRLFLGSSKNSSNIASQGDMGYMSTYSRQTLEVFRLLFRIESADDNRITSKIHRVSLNLGRSWERKCQEAARILDITHIFNGQYSVSGKLEYIKSALKEKDSTDWSNKLFDDRNTINGNKLRTYRKYKTQLFDISYCKTVVNRSHRRILANFRSGALPLAIETGRYARPQIPLDERKCNFCNRNCIENEIHFLVDCDLYTDLRYELFHKAQQLADTFHSFDSEEKFIFLKSNDQLQPSLAKTLYYMFYRRKFL